MVRRRIQAFCALATLSVAAMIGAPAAHADQGTALAEPVHAIWRQHQLLFVYNSFRVQYSCSGLRTKIGSILKAMGAHRDVAVDVNCDDNDLVSLAQMMVTFKLPVIASEANVRAATTYTTEQELVARLRRVQLPSATDLPRFTAQLRTVTVTRDRRLSLDSGDCDLLEGVRDQLLPKLGISVTEKGFRCYSDGSRVRPKFEVATLVPIEPAEPVAVATEARAIIE